MVFLKKTLSEKGHRIKVLCLMVCCTNQDTSLVANRVKKVVAMQQQINTIIDVSFLLL